MQFLTSSILLALSAVVAAQSSAGNPLTACAAAPIVESCLSTTSIAVQNCAVQDYECLCAAYKAQATCYNNCPNDQRAPSAQQQIVANCAAASQLSVLSAQTATGSSTIRTSTTSSVDAMTTAEQTATSTGAAATTKASTGAAVKNNVAGLAGVAAVVAALL